MRKCRIGTAKFFTLLLLLYRTSVNGPAVNLAGVLAVAAGSLVGIFVTCGIKPVNSLAAAALVFLVLDRLTAKKS